MCASFALSVSKPRDLFLLPPSLPLFHLRRVLCISSILGCILFCCLQGFVEVHELVVLALMLTAVWSVWPKAPHSLQSLPGKLDLWARSMLPQQGSRCCLSSRVKPALAAEAEGTACRVGWVAITWSLLKFYVLSITQQEKCRSTARSLKGARQRQWAHMRGCWAGWSCTSAVKVVFSSITDVVCELGLSQRYNFQKYLYVFSLKILWSPPFSICISVSCL